MQITTSQMTALSRLRTLNAHILPPKIPANEAVDGSKISPTPQNTTIFKDKGKVVMVVLIGWLGAKPHHLKVYEEWYKSRGINEVIKFVVEPRELFCFELEGGPDKRTSELGNDLASWLSEKEEDGRQRCLIFHVFSNTGWIVYGNVLEDWQSRPDLKEKIKGCVVDSGAGDASNPKVWEAGYAAALGKKHGSSAVNIPTTIETSEMYNADSAQVLEVPAEKEPSQMNKTNQYLLLEKPSHVPLNLSSLNKFVTRSVSSLTKNQTFPQLYLYSTADKVVPFRSIETFIEEQRKMGKNVFAFNFESSPHVDHYRNFPSLYSSELYNFLQLCL